MNGAHREESGLRKGGMAFGFEKQVDDGDDGRDVGTVGYL